ncbi:MAG: CAAX prenyl protease-related protein [Chthoniobacterales bacterium]
MSVPADSIPEKRKLIAYAAPMLVFIGMLAVASLIRHSSGPLWFTAPELWIFPLQTLFCAGILFYFRRSYEPLRWQKLGFACAIGLVALIIWIAPQQFLGFPSRIVGFNPELLSAQPTLYWSTIGMRFLRLVVVVPLVEEIFWRGFLLRYLISENFSSVAFGTFSWFSFAITTLAFAFSHAIADWPAALATGALYNSLAYRTKNLGACVVAHAVTNLLLGLWIMKTRQWGFW